jgi:hypothetical protein
MHYKYVDDTLTHINHVPIPERETFVVNINPDLESVMHGNTSS